MIRVFINALSAGNLSGTGRYAAELCRALARLEGAEARYICLIEEDFHFRAALEASPAVEIIVQPRRSPLARTAWEAMRLPSLVRRRKADVFHAPAFIAPSRLPCPSVVTVHDCAFLRFPSTIRRFRRLYYQYAIPRSARRAVRVAVDSESTRRDAIELMKLDPNRLRVIPLGVGEEFFAVPPGDAEEHRLRERLGVEGPFILTFGTMEPRKNVDTLIRAYARAQARMRSNLGAAPPLVIAGRLGWLSEGLEALARDLGVGASVRFTGFVRGEELPGLISLATLFVCVSYYEGFGLPALEAMAAGAPVVVSNASSLPEVVGAAGQLVNPASEEEIATAMSALLADPARRARLAQAGRLRAREFTWERTAQGARDLYCEAAGLG